MPSLSVANRELDLPSSRYAELIVRAIEAAAQVRRRSQFFMWSQNQLHALLPHQLAVCGSYQRLRKDLEFDAFFTVPVAAGLLATLSDPQSALMRRLVALWVEGQGRCAVVNLQANPHAPASPASPAVLALCWMPATRSCWCTAWPARSALPRSRPFLC